MCTSCPDCNASRRIKIGGVKHGASCDACGCSHALSDVGELGSTPLDGLPYDPGFKAAVSAGHLTVREAIQRGDRFALASKLAQRHGLPMRRAFLVVDNRLSFYAAKRMTKNQAVEPPLRRAPSSMSPGRVRIFLGLAGVFLFALTISGWVARGNGEQSSQEGLETTRRAIVTLADSPEIRTDHRGQVIEVSGRDPRSVLDAYCRANSLTRTLQPVKLAPSTPPSPSSLIGVFRDHGKPEWLYGIEIHREGGRWIAGSSNGQIPVRRAAPAARTPVS